jgi:hypothetical protein
MTFFANLIDDQSNINRQNKSKTEPMKTESHPTSAVFPQSVSAAVAQLKRRLQQNYEQAYPQLREIIRLVVDEEESNARKLTLFPHLILPDLVEAHVEKLNLASADTAHDDMFARHGFPKIANYQAAVALCGS